MSAVYCPLFEEDNMFISATSAATAAGGRLGCTRIALGKAGIMPVEKVRGSCDLYSKPLRIAHKAVAGNFVSAAQLLMGGAGKGYRWDS